MTTVNVNESEMFHQLLSLTGKEVDVTLVSGKAVRGKVTYTMFDSFIVEGSGKKAVIRFVDVLTLSPSN